MKERTEIWATAAFGDWPISIIDGDRSGKYPKTSEFVESGVPFINTTNLTDGKIDQTSLNYVTPEKASCITKGRTNPFDIVITTRGTIGKVAIVPKQLDGGIINAQMLIVRSDPKQLDPIFLFQSIRGPFFQAQLRSFASGSAQPQIPIRDLRQIPFSAPPLPTQRRIASVLSAYDDLIENNTRRIAILEEMARRLYEEWFVQFRFPGHEGGEQPTAWVKIPFEAALSNHIGGGWGKEEPDAQHTLPAHVIRGTDIPGSSVLNVSRCPYRFHKSSNLKSRKLAAGDVVFEVSGGSHDQSVGRALYVSQELISAFGGDVICASFCKKLAAKNSVMHPYLLYLHLRHIYDSKHIDEFQVQSTGIKNFQFEAFLNKEELVVPPIALQTAFLDATTPMLRLHQRLGAKNANLRAQRDLLLPKLISGEIDVSNIFINEA